MTTPPSTQAVTAATPQPLAPRTVYEPIVVTTLADGQELILPIHRLGGSRPGPTLGLVALLHGDETLPNEIIRRVLAETEVDELAGTVLAIPAAYGPALESLTRNGPLDMLDLNRSFPGDPGGWATEQLAHVVADRFLPQLDYLIDIHSGGVFPTVDYVYMLDGAKELALALGLEHVYQARDPHPGGLVGLAQRLGVGAVILEIGGGLVADTWLVEKGVRAVRNALRHLGMIEGEVELPERRFVFDQMAWLRPRVGGILYPVVGYERLGTLVGAHELLGRVVNPLTFEILEELRSPYERGHLVLLRPSLSRVNPGDFAYMVGDADAEVEAT